MLKLLAQTNVGFHRDERMFSNMWRKSAHHVPISVNIVALEESIKILLPNIMQSVPSTLYDVLKVALQL